MSNATFAPRIAKVALAALVARPCCARLERLSVDAAEEVEGWFTLLLTATSLRALDCESLEADKIVPFKDAARRHRGNSD